MQSTTFRHIPLNLHSVKYIPLYIFTFHYASLHPASFHYVLLRSSTLHSINFHPFYLQSATFQYIPLPSITPSDSIRRYSFPLRSSTFLCIAHHCKMLLYTPFCSIPLLLSIPYITSHLQYMTHICVHTCLPTGLQACIRRRARQCT